MERPKNLDLKIFILLVILFSVGVIGHLIPATLPLMKSLTPFTLLLASGILFSINAKAGGKPFIYWFTATYIITYIFEVAGVYTGVIFGEYQYGDTLGFKLAGVPLIIGINWVFVIAGALTLAKGITGKMYSTIFLTAVLCVLFDFIMEPVAMKLGYWQWESGIIPLQNYIAWFIISLLFAYTAVKKDVKLENLLLKRYFVIQFCFFAILNIGL